MPRGSRLRVLVALALAVAALLALAGALLHSSTQPKPAVHQAATLPPPGLDRVRSPAWRLKLERDFDHGLTKGSWNVYYGTPLGDQNGFFAASHVTVAGGILTLDTYRDQRFGGRWVSGGLSSGPALRQTYGKYLVRARMSAGQGIIGAILLWPVHGVAPPQVNFAKNVGSGPVRDELTASVTPSWGLPVARATATNWSTWHTFGLQWTPRRLVFTIDGRTWATILGGEVPAVPMEMDIQSQAAACGPNSICPGASTPAHVRLQVAWVRIYAYRGAR